MPTAVEMLRQANKLARDGRADEAIPIYRAILDVAPEEGRAWEALGTIHLRRSQWKVALGFLERAATLQPPSPGLHTNLGLAFQQNGRPVEARQSYEKAIRLYNRHLNANANLGALLQEQGELEEAAAQFERVLEIAPGEPHALANLAAIEFERGNHTEAERLARAAIRWPIELPEARLTLGRCLSIQGRLDEAEATLREALPTGDWRVVFDLAGVLRRLGRAEEAAGQYRHVLDFAGQVPDSLMPTVRAYSQPGAPPKRLPDDPELKSLLDRATADHQAGCFPEATEAYHRILAREPHCLVARHLLGVAMCQQGRGQDGLRIIAETVAEDPLNADFAFNQGNALRRAERLREARAALERTLLLHPQHAEACFNLALVEHRLKESERAVNALRRALKIQPVYTKALVLLAQILCERRETEEALALAERALELEPNHAGAHVVLGGIAEDQGNVETARRHYERAVELEPKAAHRHLTLGNLFYDLHQFDEARRLYDAAVALRPGYELAIYARGISHLLEGDLREGWDDYEERWREEGNPRHETDAPRWSGEPFAGKTLLVHCEQGLGDTLQMVRYLPRVKTLGGSVVLYCQNKMTSVLSGCVGIDRIVEYRDAKPMDIPHDLHVPLLSLPRAFGTTRETIPSDVSYIHIENAAQDEWEARIPPPEGRRRVAIFWQGNPNYPLDRRRSIPLVHWEPLLAREDLQIISVQKYHGRDQLLASPFRDRILDLGGELDNGGCAFLDTAAVLQSVDLLITSDSAIAHLAGALGRPAWVILPYTPDWRWGIAAGTTPWYPTLRLFRQRERANWASAMTDVNLALDSHV